jgi:serine/threonine-protein kinase
MIGKTVAHYKITGLLGQGGMGVVYLAHDTRLDRSVAVKTLPEHLATDPERLERFQNEARLVAQLNHPNVAGIHGLEEQDGQRFLVLEYVEGESLTRRLARGPLALEEAVAVAQQIASGVDAAHRAGVIHRDLKPDNIRLTPQGEVKVLDFGLAKFTAGTTSDSIGASELANSPTVQNSPTMPGVILGTAAYMSPEQAQGKPLDRRTDVWSFAVVLYECLTGVSPFAGETASDSIGAVLHKDVDLDLLPAETPRLLRHLLRGCLQRDLANRYRDIGDVGLELRHVLSAEDEPASVSGGLALIVGVVAAAIAWVLKPTTPSAPLPVLNAEIVLPEGQRLTHGFMPGIAISPDGQMLAFFTGDTPAPELRPLAIEPQRLMVRPLSQPDAVEVPGAEMSGSEPCFSPDGQWLAFWTESGLQKIAITGGQPTVLAPVAPTMGLSWGEDDMIVAGRYGAGLARFSSEAGELEDLTTLDLQVKEHAHSQPHVLPGAKAVLFTVQRFGYQMRAPSAWSIWALDLRTRERHRVVEHASHASYFDGSIVFLREAVLYAAPFDLASLEMTGTPRVLVEGVQHSIYSPFINGETGAGQYALAANGTLAYVEGSVTPALPRQIFRVDRQGNATLIGVEPRPYVTVRGSDDGAQILLSVHYPPATGVWSHDLIRRVTRRQRTGDQGHIAFFGPGPQNISYDETDSEGARRNFSKPIGSAVDDGETQIPDPPVESVWALEWSHDGNVLLGYDLSSAALWAYTESDGWYKIPGQNPRGGRWPTLSPDGRWLAYGIFADGRFEIMVQPFGHAGSSVQISENGGNAPIWSHDGRQLYYRAGGYSDLVHTVVAVPVTDEGDRIQIGSAEELFDESFRVVNPFRAWDLLGDDAFVFISEPQQDEYHEDLLEQYGNRIRVIQNWGERLK